MEWSKIEGIGRRTCTKLVYKTSDWNETFFLSIRIRCDWICSRTENLHRVDFEGQASPYLFGLYKSRMKSNEITITKSTPLYFDGSLSGSDNVQNVKYNPWILKFISIHHVRKIFLGVNAGIPVRIFRRVKTSSLWIWKTRMTKIHNIIKTIGIVCIKNWCWWWCE